MVSSELDSVLATALIYLQLKPSWLACVPNVLFIAFAPNFSFIQAFKRQRARCLNKRPSLESQASELGETAGQPRF